MPNIEKLPLTSMDIKDHQLEKLKELFPEVFTEGNKIDWEKLKLTLGENVDTGKERFGMNWPGKADCFKTIQQPSIATLVPDREESIDFDNTQNLFIEGDNLEVLKLLQKSYLGKIKMIYIDPPYNTGNDFIYPDNYAENLSTYLEYTGQVDSEGKKFSTNTETDGRFHSKWMNMMYPRLFLAKNLLCNNGAIFISIDDKEVCNLRSICNEVFGEENFVAQLIWDGGRKNDSKKVSVGHEYIIVYTKEPSLEDSNDPTLWRERKEGIDRIYEQYDRLRKLHINNWEEVSKGLQEWFSSLKENDPAKSHKHYRFADKEGVYFASDLSGPDDGRKNRPRYTVLHPITKKPVPIPSRGWRWEEDRMKEEIKSNRVHFGTDESSIPNGKVYLKENEYQAPSSVFYKDRRSASNSLKSLMGEKVFDFPKDHTVLSSLIKLIVRKDDIVLDFFAGSGSTAQAILELSNQNNENYNFIMIQLPEQIKEGDRAYQLGYKTIADISKDRIRKVVLKINSDREKIASREKETLFAGDKDFNIDVGFKVFKLKSSNFKIWDAEIEKNQDVIQTALDLHVNHLSAAAQEESILYEILLKSGFELTTSIEKLEIEGKTVYSIADGDLLICLEKGLTQELIKAIAEKQPTRVICLDEGFQNNDQLKTNAVQIMKSKNVVSFRTV
jgi:adenine-specific DNA-methyltransferase